MHEKTARPINQHFVPRFLLRNFRGPKKNHVYVFDKQEDRVFRAKPERIATRKHFYDFKLDGKTFTVDPALTKLEDRCAPIINKIINYSSIGWLSPRDKELISLFVATQLIRTQQQRLWIKETDRKLLERFQVMGLDTNKIQGYQPLKDEDLALFHVNFISKTAPELAFHIFTKTWLLFRSPIPHCCYISDNPVVLQNHKVFSPRGNLGLAVDGIEIYLPISKNLVLGFFCPSYEEQFREGYIQFRSLSALAPQLVAAKIKNPLLMESFNAGLESGRSIMLSPENITNINSLQVVYASRFVFCATNSFELVRTMISGDASLRRGPEITVY